MTLATDREIRERGTVAAAPRLVGAVSGGLFAGAALAVPTMYGFLGLAIALSRVDQVVIVAGVGLLVGSTYGNAVTSAGRVRALALGVVAAGTCFVVAVVAVNLADLLEFTFRNGMVPDLASGFEVIVIAVLWGGLAFLPAIVVSGSLWAATTRLVSRSWHPQLPSRLMSNRMLRVQALSSVTLALVVISAGVRAYQATPQGARCLDVGGETPVSGAWSPDGRRLVIASNPDPNSIGHIWLFDWPSGSLTQSWPAWVEDNQTVVVDDSGRVYWHSTEMQEPWTEAIMTVSPGETQHILVVRTDELLWDMGLAAGEIRGETSNSHEPVHIPLSGADTGSVLPMAAPVSPVGALWWSPDGRWLVIGSEWDQTAPFVQGPNGVQFRLADDTYARTFAMSPDRRAVISASELGPSKVTDLASGRATTILSGQQRWIIVSELGDVAWANDETAGRPCVVPLANLTSAG